MASHSQDNPHTLSTPEMSNSPQPEEEQLFPEIPYALPHEELNQFRRITRAYARQIGVLPLAPILPRRKQISRPVVNTPDEVFRAHGRRLNRFRDHRNRTSSESYP
jgi:hypothetical protein